MRKQYLLDPNFVPAKKSKKKIANSVTYYIVGAVISLFFILPLLYMFAASTKSDELIAIHNTSRSIMMFIPDFSNIAHLFDNYAEVITQYDIWKYALNSLGYASIIIVLNIIVNGLAGYVLAKFHFPGKGFFSFIIIFLIVVPVETSILPLYTIVRGLFGLKGTVAPILAVIVPSIISVFNIFLFTQFFASIPKEFEEAMHIDGANRIRMFFDLILPLSLPIVATTAVFTFIGVWNDYLWPSMVLPNTGYETWSLLPIQAGLESIKATVTSDPTNLNQTGQIMASLVITSLPVFIIYIAAQKYIVKGFGTAGLKM